jgi:hypothetical protein
VNILILRGYQLLFRLCDNIMTRANLKIKVAHSLKQQKKKNEENNDPI